jgi:outer membrane protein assembly factor BamB
MLRIITVLLVFNFLNITLSAQNFVQWRGMNRDGKYDEKGLLKVWPENGPTLLWHFDDLGSGFSSAAVTDKYIYTAGTFDSTGYVFCLDLSGKQVWKVTYGKEWIVTWPGSRTTPMISEGKLYLMSGYGKIVCMDAEKGTLIWSADMQKDYDGRNITWAVTENLLIDGNKLFCTAGGIDANIVALDKNTGKLVWKCKGNGEKSAYGSPALINLGKRQILVTMTEKSILGIDAEIGELLWSSPQTNKYSVHPNTPIYYKGSIYCVSGYGGGGVMLKLSADGRKVEVAWRDTIIHTRHGGVILLNDKIYGSGDATRLWSCIDWNTGKKIASEKILSKDGNIIFADGMFYCYDEAGEVALVQPLDTGLKKISSFKVPFGSAQHWAHLVINKGRLYVRHGKSMMVYSIK